MGGGGVLISMSSFNEIRSLPPRAQMETRFVIGTENLRGPISPTLLTCDSRSPTLPRSGHHVFTPPPHLLRKCSEAADYPASLGDAGRPFGWERSETFPFSCGRKQKKGENETMSLNI